MKNIKSNFLAKNPPIFFWVILILLSLSGILITSLYSELLRTSFPTYFLVFNITATVLALFYSFLNISNLRKLSKNKVIGTKFARVFITIIPLMVIVPTATFYYYVFETVKDEISKLGVLEKGIEQILVKTGDIVSKDINDYIEETIFDRSKNLFRYVEGFSKFNQENDLDVRKSLKPLLDKMIKDNWACYIGVQDMDGELLVSSIDESVKTCNPFFDDPLPPTQPIIADISRDGKYIQTKLSTRFITRAPTLDYMTLSIVYLVEPKLMEVLSTLNKLKTPKVDFKLSHPTLLQKFSIQFSSTVLLSIITVLIIILTGAKRLLEPLNSLSLATREISKGNYDVRVETDENYSDLKLLLKFFNEMSEQIKQSREGLDTHNLYLETILKYSYGVVALDSDRKIQFFNNISAQMLELNPEKQFVGNSFLDIGRANKNLKELVELIKSNFSKEEWDAEIKISFPEKNKLILCQGAKLRAHSRTLGYLIVLNDITELIGAQKKAAWGEVAMKMAHEVKNPLTPILLSADRLRNKFLDTLEGKDLEIMEKTTSTIIEQVKSMSIMVEAFSEFANIPKINKKSQNLNAIINHAIELYDADQEVNVSLDLSGSLPDIYLDSESIKRLFINLIKNSKEARASDVTNIKIKSEPDKNKKIVRVIIDDDGEGFDSSIIDKIFEPYASTKITGSGLGLAIVHNIVEQHNGNIFAKNIKPHGARIVIEFPLGN